MAAAATPFSAYSLCFQKHNSTTPRHTLLPKIRVPIRQNSRFLPQLLINCGSGARLFTTAPSPSPPDHEVSGGFVKQNESSTLERVGAVGLGTQVSVEAQNPRNFHAKPNPDSAMKIDLSEVSSSIFKAHAAGFIKENVTRDDIFETILDSDMVLLVVSDSAQGNYYVKSFTYMKPNNICVVVASRKAMGLLLRWLYFQGKKIHVAGINASFAPHKAVDGRANDITFERPFALGSPFPLGARGALLGKVRGIHKDLAYKAVTELVYCTWMSMVHSAALASGNLGSFDHFLANVYVASIMTQNVKKSMKYSAWKELKPKDKDYDELFIDRMKKDLKEQQKALKMKLLEIQSEQEKLNYISMVETNNAPNMKVMKAKKIEKVYWAMILVLIMAYAARFLKAFKTADVPKIVRLLPPGRPFWEF